MSGSYKTITVSSSLLEPLDAQTAPPVERTAATERSESALRRQDGAIATEVANDANERLLNEDARNVKLPAAKMLKLSLVKQRTSWGRPDNIKKSGRKS